MHHFLTLSAALGIIQVNLAFALTLQKRSIYCFIYICQYFGNTEVLIQQKIKISAQTGKSLRRLVKLKLCRIGYFDWE